MLWTLTITYSWAKPSNLFCNKLPTNSHNLLTPGHKTCRQCSIECTWVSLLPGADLDFTLAQHQLWLRSCLEYSHIKVLLMWLCACALKLGGWGSQGLALQLAKAPEAQLPVLLLTGAGTCLFQLPAPASAVAFLHCLHYWFSTFLRLQLFNTS